MLKTLEKRKTMSQSDSPLTYIYFVMFYMRSVEKLSLLVHRIINVINFFSNFQKSNISHVYNTLVHQSKKL
jgi:hypothetical protein